MRSPRGSGARTVHTCYVIDLDQYRRKKKKARRQKLPHVVHLMRKAREFQAFSDSREVSSRAELARREGITRPRVTQIMNVLRLAPDIQKAILGIPKETGERVVTERKLRELVVMEDHDEQRAAFEAMTDSLIGKGGCVLNIEEVQERTR